MKDGIIGVVTYRKGDQVVKAELLYRERQWRSENKPLETYLNTFFDPNDPEYASPAAGDTGALCLHEAATRTGGEAEYLLPPPAGDDKNTVY